MLATGKRPESGFDEQRDGTHYLSLLRPLLNEKRCHHCHGSSRSVLGGLLVEQNSDSMFTAIQAMRNKNMLIGLLGSLAVALVLILMVSKLVSRPIRHVISGLNETAGKRIGGLRGGSVHQPANGGRHGQPGGGNRGDILFARRNVGNDQAERRKCNPGRQTDAARSKEITSRARDQ